MRKASKNLSLKSLVAFALLALFSCSIPFFGKGRVTPNDASQKLATISGVLEFKTGCEPGSYQVTLKGLFEGAGAQQVVQSDALGKFSFTAPPGKYLVQVEKNHCGVKQSVELENNTEHMYLFAVQEFKAVEKVGDEEEHFPSRLPASILIPSSNSN